MSREQWNKLLAPFLYRTGLYLHQWRRAANFVALVVTYHRIAPPGGRGEPPLFGVERGLPVDVFEAQLRFLLRHFTPLPASEIAAENQRAVLRFAVTFDDGYDDNRTLAAPVLTRLGIPATFYLTTDFIESDRLFWWEQLGELLRGARATALHLKDVAPQLARRFALPQTLPLGGFSEREQAHWWISMALMRTPPVEIPALLQKLAAAAEAPLRSEGRAAPLLSWEGVRRLARDGFELGAHTLSHANLGLLSEVEIENEVLGSIERVAREIDRPVLSFAYPYGGSEHRSEAARRAVAKGGCRVAFTTGGAAFGPGSDPLFLPRTGFTRASADVCAYQTHQAIRAMPRRAD